MTLIQIHKNMKKEPASIRFFKTSSGPKLEFQLLYEFHYVLNFRQVIFQRTINPTSVKCEIYVANM